MKTINLTVNGKSIDGVVEPRTHLADFLRDQLQLTATHLRCEQGVCGACTLLIDGQPARSCITFAVLCQGSDIVTLEGLQTDVRMQALQRAFAAEHGLQCGFCTPGMLITARDIITRLPDADEARVRAELSGNLCRCTGYAGIVRAICRVLAERRGVAVEVKVAKDVPRLGPIGARKAVESAWIADVPATVPSTVADSADDVVEETDIGLGSRQANLETTTFFTVPRPVDDVWKLFDDIDRIARCMPGASIVGQSENGRIKGRIAVKFGPMSTSFTGSGLVTRDEALRRGVVYGFGRDRFSGSSVRAEVAYALRGEGEVATRVDLTVRALLAGPLAQFSRSGIVQDLVRRLTAEFARRLERNLATGEYGAPEETSLSAGALALAYLRERLKALWERVVPLRRP